MSSSEPSSRAHLYQEFVRRLERARARKDEATRLRSQLEGIIAEAYRVLRAKEDERFAVALRRPRTSEALRDLQKVERELHKIGEEIAEMEQEKDKTLQAIRAADAEMSAARAKLNRGV